MVQYVASHIPGDEDSNMGYLDDPTVPKGSCTPTYASCVLRINNERWDGVPFVMKAGKGAHVVHRTYDAFLMDNRYFLAKQFYLPSTHVCACGLAL